MRRRALLAAAGGICSVLPFFWDKLFLASLAGSALYFAAMYDGGRLKRSFSLSMIYGAAFYLPLYYWFTALYPFGHFGFTPVQGWVIIVAACVGISAVHSLALASVMKLASFLHVAKPVLPAVFACAIMLDEFLISLGSLGFSWGMTASAQTGFLPAVQTVSVFGAYFVTVIVTVSGALIGLAICDVPSRRKLWLCVGAGIYCANAIAGTVLLYSDPHSTGELDVACVQGNILSNEKWDNSYALSVERYAVPACELATSGEYDLVVLPESSFPFLFDTGSSLANEISDSARQGDTAVLMGVLLNTQTGKFNGTIAADSDGSYSSAYGKRHLVPFGEYIPALFKSISFIENLNLGGMDYTPGQDSALITLRNGIRIGSLVCFDSIFSSLSRESVRDGATLLVVVTNDSWFKDTRAVYQHASFSKLRAIETGRCVVRAANTGVSMLIDSKGRVISELGPLVQGVVDGTVYTSDNMTLYTRIGDVVLWAAPLLTALAQIFMILANRNKRNSNGDDSDEM